MKSIICITLFLTCSSAFASPNNSPNCFGSDTYYTCRDISTGNTYNVSKHGNNTHVQANNYNTGSSWSQDTQTYGNQSYTTGRDANGNSWHHNTHQIGNTQYYNGNDSSGKSYNGYCNPYSGCRTNR